MLLSGIQYCRTFGKCRSPDFWSVQTWPFQHQLKHGEYLVVCYGCYIRFPNFSNMYLRLESGHCPCGVTCDEIVQHTSLYDWGEWIYTNEDRDDLPCQFLDCCKDFEFPCAFIAHYEKIANECGRLGWYEDGLGFRNDLMICLKIFITKIVNQQESEVLVWCIIWIEPASWDVISRVGQGLKNEGERDSRPYNLGSWMDWKDHKESGRSILENGVSRVVQDQIPATTDVLIARDCQSSQ